MLHLAMPHPLGTRVEFSVNSFLRELGRGTGNTQHEQFKETVVRLIGGVVEITSLRDQKTFIGALVSGAYREESTGRYVVKFNEDMLTLYQTGYTLIDAGQRQALGKSSLCGLCPAPDMACRRRPSPKCMGCGQAITGSHTLAQTRRQVS